MKPIKNDVPFRKGDFLKVAKPTNFHDVGGIVLVDATDWYGVVLRNKPGHYHSDSFVAATPEDLFAALAAQSPQGERVSPPEAWVLVPRDPTREMLVAGASDDTPRTSTNSMDRMFETVGHLYRAMLSAAPSAPAPALSADVERLVKAAWTLVNNIDQDRTGAWLIRGEDPELYATDALTALAPFADRVGGEEETGR